jgi:hypothetical protein
MTRLEHVSSFALWLVPEKPPLLQGAFRCADEKLAQKIAEEELGPRQKAHSERFKFSRDGAWLDVQLKLEADRVE